MMKGIVFSLFTAAALLAVALTCAGLPSDLPFVDVILEIIGTEFLGGPVIEPTDVTIDVSITDNLIEYHTGCEGELAGYDQTLSITAVGRLSGRGAGRWEIEDVIYAGQYHGWYHCYSPWGPEHDFTHTWDSALFFDNLNEAPQVVLRVYDDEVYVLLGPGEASYFFPGDPDRTYCQEPEREPAGYRSTHIEYWRLTSAERPPDAESSMLQIVNSGIVLMRVPIAELYSGIGSTAVLLLDRDCRGDVNIAITLQP